MAKLPKSHGWRQQLSLSLQIGCLSWGILGVTSVGAQSPEAINIPAANASLEEQAAFWVNFPTFSALNHDFCTRAYGAEEQFCETADVLGASFHTSPSSSTLSLPSLWWTRDQLPRHIGGSRLVQAWAVYQLQSGSHFMVDVFVDSQIWGVLSAYERYSVLNLFGNTTKEYGYHLRLYRGKGRGSQLTGIYLCEFQAGNLLASEQARLSNQDSHCEATIDPDVLAAYENYESP